MAQPRTGGVVSPSLMDSLIKPHVFAMSVDAHTSGIVALSQVSTKSRGSPV